MARNISGVDEFDLPSYGAVDDFDAITAAMGILSSKLEAESIPSTDD